ncbi:SsgA family sporulation/cell division regulator [Streptomyces sp. PA03-1a]|nr:SsgA family sporulation/cell division regulator [Streptomyces sp. PA03-1a]MDX2816700.1 SsgA family sporulation/cell division regulator [Streptomyces sp. PA03-5A]
MRALTEHLSLRLITGTRRFLDLSADCRYRSDDPYIVRMRFGLDDGAGEAEWVLSRELLLAGLAASAGDGDVHVEPGDHAHTLITLAAPGGTAVLQVATGELARFLAATAELVPLGTEGGHIDWDACIAGLLSA